MTDSEERVQCTECGARILPRTAVDNDGLCAQCIQTPVSLRLARQKFEQTIISGEVYVPTARELESAQTPIFLTSETTFWKPGPEYYADTEITTCEQAISDAFAKERGDVFLTAGNEIWVTLAFNKKYGVCYYENGFESDYRYARSPRNLSQQVTEDLHLSQDCSCCGDGLFWFPSRYHMDRIDAFNILRSVLKQSIPASVKWLKSCDFTRTGRGYG